MPEFLSVPAILQEDLVLPLAGADGIERKYTVKAATAENYLKLSVLKIAAQGVTVSDADAAHVTDMNSVEGAWALSLGHDTLAEILKDGVSAADLRRATQTAFYWHTADGDESLAERAWSGKASTTSPTSSETLSDVGGDAEPTTSAQASTSGTSTPKASSPGKRRTSTGRTSGNGSTPSSRTSKATTA